MQYKIVKFFESLYSSRQSLHFLILTKPSEQPYIYFALKYFLKQLP